MESIISLGSVTMKPLIKSEPLIKRITVIELIFGIRLVSQAFGSSGRKSPLFGSGVAAVYLLADRVLYSPHRSSVGLFLTADFIFR